MTRLLIVLALVFSPAPSPRTIRLVLIAPVGETVDMTAIQTAQQSVMGAASFWHDRAPFAFELWIASTETITTTADVYTRDIAWAMGLGDPQHITIVVVDNRVSRRQLLLGDAGGWAAPWANLAVVTLRQAVGLNALAAIIAHELGHVLFNLPDLYDIPGACTHTDIMCFYVAAYNTPAIGCASLAALGYPCQKVHMPTLLR
jgi:hypothetical protein